MTTSIHCALKFNSVNSIMTKSHGNLARQATTLSHYYVTVMLGLNQLLGLRTGSVQG